MKNILQQQFKAVYNRTAFITNVLRPIFQGKVKDFTIYDDKGSQSIPLTDSEKDIAKSIVKYGKLVTADERTIDLYEVIIHDNKIIERNKVSVGALIKKQIIGNNAIFVNFAYENPENKNWRFSFIAYDSVFEDGDIKTVQTNPKRYTYIFGEKEETYKTALDCFSKLADEFEIKIAKIKDAFGVEAMSKLFFDEYRDRHYKNFINHILHSNYKISAFDGDEKAIRDFVKKLLGRIVFLYFLQKKGWLGASSINYTDGDKNFISNFFKEAKQGADFYPVWLSKLFFDTLNEKRTADNFTMPNGKEVKIPYLNGGLFERESAKYDFITFDSELFINLFEFFDQYNFTVYEDSPDDHTVAVDPEMLGHIFENLLEDNKDKGAFYTPKQIVQYMTQESLIEYLITHLKSTDKDKLSAFVKDKTNELSKDELKTIDRLLDDVKICDPAIGSGAFPMGLLQEIFGLKEKIAFELGFKEWSPATVKENIIQNSIYGVDIEKGAVDIARLRFWLSLIVDEDLPKALPNLDYKIVVGNSLVSKFEDQIIEIDWEVRADEQTDIFGSPLQEEKEQLLREISAKQKLFFHTESKDKKKLATDIRKTKAKLLAKQLEQMIATKGFRGGEGKIVNKKQLEAKLETEGWKNTLLDLKRIVQNPELPFNHFDWKLDFPEILNSLVAKENGGLTSTTGFDIVIGNPPYVEAKKLKSIGQFLKKYNVYSGTADLSSYFFELGLNLCKSSGLLSLINTNKFFNTGYGKPLRTLIVQNEIKQLLNFEQVEVFEGILVSSVIIGIKKKTPLTNNVFPFKKFFKMKNSEFITKFVNEVNNRDKYNQSNLTNGEWSFADDSNLSLKGIIEKNATQLKDIKGVSIYRGVTTGYNPAFIINDEKKQELIKADKKNNEVIKSLLQGRNIRKWIYNESDENLLFIPWHFPLHNDESINGNSIVAEKALNENYNSIYNHLLSFKQNLSNRNKEETGIRYEWYALQRCAASYYNEFEKPEKIIWGLTADKWAYAYDDKKHYLPSNGYILTSENMHIKYLLGLLNSSLLKYYFSFIGVMTAGGAYTLKHATIQQLPIKIAKNQQIFIDKVEQILSFKSEAKSTFALEQELDNIIYRLYELSYDEVKIIDTEFSLSKNEYEALKFD